MECFHWAGFYPRNYVVLWYWMPALWNLVFRELKEVRLLGKRTLLGTDEVGYLEVLLPCGGFEVVIPSSSLSVSTRPHGSWETWDMGIPLSRRSGKG